MAKGKSQNDPSQETAPAVSDSRDDAATTAPKKKSDSRSSDLKSPSHLLKRFRIAGNVLLQIALAFVIFFQLNYVSCQKYDRWDLTQNRKFTLSDTSLNFLSRLDSEVTLVMAFLGSSELFDDVKGLLSEYERNGGNHVNAEVLNLSVDRQRLAQFRDQHGIEFTRDSLVILSRDRKKVIGAEELVTRERKTGRIIEFRGEEILTSAMLEVTEKQQKKIYLVIGKRQGDEILSIAEQLKRLSETQNTRLESLALEGTPKIPDDAGAVILAGNTQPLTEREVQVLADFWHNEDDPEKRGALVVMLDPSTQDEALNTFLRTHGVGPGNDRVLSVTSIPGLADRKITDVTVAMLEGPGVAPQLARMTTQLAGQTQSLAVEMDSDLLKMDNIHPRPLMITAQNFWGETDFRREDVTFSEEQDNPWPIYTAASVTKGSLGDPSLNQKTSRLVVIANPDLIDPRGNTAKVNADFLMSALNWTLDRDQLVGISPRKPTSYVLAVDPAKYSLLQNLILLGIPTLAFIAAGFVWYTRRS